MPNYNPTPKEVFCSKPQNVTEHHVLVENDIIRRSLDAAMAQYTRVQASQQVADLGSGCMAFMRLQGAQEFVHLFYNLCETQQVSQGRDDFNLPSNVKAMPQVAKKG